MPASSTLNSCLFFHSCLTESSSFLTPMNTVPHTQFDGLVRWMILKLKSKWTVYVLSKVKLPISIVHKKDLSTDWEQKSYLKLCKANIFNKHLLERVEFGRDFQLLHSIMVFLIMNFLLWITPACSNCNLSPALERFISRASPPTSLMAVLY
jgi:hypothetical protein